MKVSYVLIIYGMESLYNGDMFEVCTIKGTFPCS